MKSCQDDESRTMDAEHKSRQTISYTELWTFDFCYEYVGQRY